MWSNSGKQSRLSKDWNASFVNSLQLISSHVAYSVLISSNLISSERAVIGRIHGELGRFAVHDRAGRA